MEKATIGLLGIALGVLLTLAKDWWLQSRKNKKEAEYLSIQIVCMLDRYVAGCAAVVGDNGLCHGQPDKEGYSHIQVANPKFTPDAERVEWKSLPANLMYEILAMPNRIEVANNRIDGAFEYSATPPDFAEGFEERQFQYAKLGIEANDLADKLRKHANLPLKHIEDWDPVVYMRERLHDILTHRKEREDRHELEFNEPRENSIENA